MKRRKMTGAPLAALLVLAATAGTGVLAQSPAGAPAPLAVTLDEAVARAKENNALLQAARADVRAKEGQFKEARSLYWPDLAFTGNFSRTNNPVYVFMGKLTQANFTMMDFALSNLNHPAPLNNWQSRVELTMPLFTSGKVTAAYRATKMGVEAAQDTSNFAESSVVKGVTQAFYGSLLAEQAVTAMDEAVKTAEAHQTQVEALYKQGLVLDSDLMRIKVYVADVRQQRAQRAADVKVARAYLAYAMGTEDDVAPKGAFSPAAEALPSLSEAQNAALESRGDLKAVTLQAGQAGEGVKMARADYLPQVGLMASYEQDTEKWQNTPWGDNWMLGIQLRIPLFDGGSRAGRLQTAKAREFQAQQALLDAQQRVRVEAKSAWLKAQAAEERVAVTTESEAAAKENQRIVSLRYQEGLAPITDLLDADMAVTAASLTRSQAIHDELVERANLTWAMGK